MISINHRRREIVAICFVALVHSSVVLGQPTVPVVQLSEGHAATCKVRVGDKFPLLPLLDVADEPVEMSELSGKLLTVVLIWNDRLAYGRHAYERFAEDFIRPLADSGVKGIAINRGDSIEVVKKSVEEHGSGIATLRDTDDQLWKQIATAQMPRVYLLDKNGMIVWMDIEFSGGTARDLHRAIKASLKAS